MLYVADRQVSAIYASVQSQPGKRIAATTARKQCIWQVVKSNKETILCGSDVLWCMVELIQYVPGFLVGAWVRSRLLRLGDPMLLMKKFHRDSYRVQHPGSCVCLWQLIEGASMLTFGVSIT